jgi:hypothetical protein
MRSTPILRDSCANRSIRRLGEKWAPVELARGGRTTPQFLKCGKIGLFSEPCSDHFTLQSLGKKCLPCRFPRLRRFTFRCLTNLVTRVEKQLAVEGIRITNQGFALAQNGQRLFGLMQVEMPQFSTRDPLQFPNIVGILVTCAVGRLACYRVESQPSDNSFQNRTAGLVMIGLPTAKGRSPNPQHLSELPLAHSQFLSFAVNVLSDRLRYGRQWSPDATFSLRSVGPCNCDTQFAISQQLQHQRRSLARCKAGDSSPVFAN